MNSIMLDNLCTLFSSIRVSWQYAELHSYVMLLKHVSYVLQLRSLTGSYHHETCLAVCVYYDRLAAYTEMFIYTKYTNSLSVGS